MLYESERMGENMEEEKKREYQHLFQQFFLQLDTFLTSKWLGAEGFAEPFSIEDRKRAYQHFYQQIKKDSIANRQTIRRWFGLDGCSIPSRDQILRMSLALGLSVEEAEEYLQYGISEPGFQINDYEECIAMYCLDNGYGWDTFYGMTEFFERHSDREIPLEQTAHTAELKEKYLEWKECPKEEFLRWMCENCALFKGYSMTTYRIFVSLIDEALHFFREEVREILFLELKETDFFAWAGKQQIPEADYGQAIRQYIKNGERRRDPILPKEKWREMKRLLVMAYSSKNRVSDLLTELYSPMTLNRDGRKKETAQMLRREIGTVNAKYVSELLGVSLHKKNQMDLNRAVTQLRQMSDDAVCPDWILALMSGGKNGKQAHAKVSVKDAKKCLEKRRTVQGQRVRNIRRSDLLILLQYISQKKYFDRISEHDRGYSGEDAREEFIELANTVLESCGMRPIDPRYRLDYILLSCFEKDEVFLFAEIFE